MFTSKGNLNPTPEQTESAYEDFQKAVSLGDKTTGTEDMIYIHCKKKQAEKEIMSADTGNIIIH
jgi:hypothetical protein